MSTLRNRNPQKRCYQSAVTAKVFSIKLPVILLFSKGPTHVSESGTHHLCFDSFPCCLWRECLNIGVHVLGDVVLVTHQFLDVERRRVVEQALGLSKHERLRVYLGLRPLVELLQHGVFCWSQGAGQDAVPENGIAEMLHVSLWGTQHAGMSLAEADKRLRDNSVVVDDLRCVLEYRLKHSPLIANRNATAFEPLAIHAAYTRDEILVALGHWNFNDRPSQREGVLHLKDRQHDVFFVTLQKTEDEYSPTTMYEDYLISHNQFHWQSQSNTSVQSPTGQRYILHGEKGDTPLLFVRETKNLPSGISAPYHFLGPCRYLSHTGSRPISIVWELEFPVPTRLHRTMARQIAV